MISKDIDRLYKSQIIRLYRKGKRPKEIAYMINVDMCQVWYLLRKYGIYKKRIRSNEECLMLARRINNMLNSGLKAPNIAKKLDISRQLVYFYKHKYKNL